MREIDFSFEPYRGPIKRMRRKISVANLILVSIVTIVALVGALGLINQKKLSPGTIYLSLMAVVYGVILYFKSLRMSKIADIWWAFATHNGGTYQAHGASDITVPNHFSEMDYCIIRDVITFPKQESNLWRMYFCDTGMNAAQKNGVHIVAALTDFAEKNINVFWLMVPQGELVDKVIAQLRPVLKKGDIIIDGGNSKFSDSMRRAQELALQDIYFIDCGT